MTVGATIPTVTVMVVEDGDSAREVLARLLRREGFTVGTATNGRQAVEKVRGGVQPDLMLMDITMPEMDGLAALSLLRQEPGFQRTPVFFFTALNDPDTQGQARRLGAAGYLVKGSTTWPDLRDTVRRYVAPILSQAVPC